MPKKIPLLLLCSVAAIAASCPASFAQQVINGAIPTALSPVGVTNGVAMTGQGGGGTLIVGTVGGPDMDIYTNNSAGGIVTNPLLQAVSTDTSSESNITFNSSSNVFGAIGVTQPGGPFFLNVNGGNNGTVVNFAGDVYATITTVNGTGTLNFNSGSTNISATNFAGDGVISLASEYDTHRRAHDQHREHRHALARRRKRSERRGRRRYRAQGHQRRGRQQHRRRKRNHQRRRGCLLVQSRNEHTEYRRRAHDRQSWSCRRDQYDIGEPDGLRQHQTGRRHKFWADARHRRCCSPDSVLTGRDHFRHRSNAGRHASKRHQRKCPHDRRGIPPIRFTRLSPCLPPAP